MTKRTEKLTALGRFALEVLEDSRDRSAATADEIARFAHSLGLASDDREGYFEAVRDG